MRRWLFSVVLLGLVSAATPALAQPGRPTDPIPVFSADIRGAFVLLNDDIKTSSTLAVANADLVGHAFGGVGGLTVYPIHRGGFAFGVGGELLIATASRQNIDPETRKPTGPEVHRDVRSMTGQLSFNFGHHKGWSYLTAGIGPWAFDSYLAQTDPDSGRQFTTNFGFGARWFNNEHTAFNLDMRFYLSPPSEQVITSGGRDRQTIVVLSAGISLK